jgi:cell division initiation protein
MKITPLDIQQMQFKVRLRGYDRREVAQFLEDLASTVEDLSRENAALREKVTAAEEEIAGLRKGEATLTRAMVSAQALTDDLKQAAQRDAELIMKEAELKASELLREARVELAGIQRDLSDLQKHKLVTVERMRSMLRTFERLLEIEAGDEEPSKISEP